MHEYQRWSTSPVIDLTRETDLATRLIFDAIVIKGIGNHRYIWESDGTIIEAFQFHHPDVIEHSIKVTTGKFQWCAIRFEFGVVWAPADFEFSGDVVAFADWLSIQSPE